MESNSEKKFNISNLEKGLQLVREGNLRQADIYFDAEMTQSNQPNSNVFIHHGHLLNMLGRYEEAIDKFESFPNNDSNVSCLFGKGISNIGLLNLDDALSLFEKVIDKCPNHADAYFYIAIIYYQNYNLIKAKEAYEMYQIKREDFFNNNPDYFYLLGDDLSIEKLGEYYDEIHNFYNLTDLFIFINQLLEKKDVDNSDEYSYKQLRLLNDGEFKIVGYDDKLIKDLSSKFNGLTIESKRTLNKILRRSKDYDISFRDLHELIRINVLDGNESINSFYEHLDYFINTHIDKKNRKLKRVEDKNKELERKNEGLKNENNTLNNEKYDLNEKIKILEKKKRELSNQLYTLSADKSDNESGDKNISILGDDFKNANSMNMISGINYEDYQKDLEILISEKDIPEKERIIFESAFEEYNAGNFNEAYELFNKLSGNFKWPQEYITFFKATSLSSGNNFEDAYGMINLDDAAKLGKKYHKDKCPILWFNFGNIFFDYANSQIIDDKVKTSEDKDKIDGIKSKVKIFSFASYCYKIAIKFVSEKKSKPVSKSNYKFIFKDEKSKEGFKKNAKMMYNRAMICQNFYEMEKLKHENES